MPRSSKSSMESVGWRIKLYMMCGLSPERKARLPNSFSLDSFTLHSFRILHCLAPFWREKIGCLGLGGCGVVLPWLSQLDPSSSSSKSRIRRRGVRGESSTWVPLHLHLKGRAVGRSSLCVCVCVGGGGGRMVDVNDQHSWAPGKLPGLLPDECPLHQPSVQHFSTIAEGQGQGRSDSKENEEKQ
jgi:hypothetical protein